MHTITPQGGVIGSERSRVDGAAKVTGVAPYGADQPVPDQPLDATAQQGLRRLGRSDGPAGPRR